MVQNSTKPASNNFFQHSCKRDTLHVGVMLGNPRFKQIPGLQRTYTNRLLHLSHNIVTIIFFIQNIPIGVPLTVSQIPDRIDTLGLTQDIPKFTPWISLTAVTEWTTFLSSELPSLTRVETHHPQCGRWNKFFQL